MDYLAEVLSRLLVVVHWFQFVVNNQASVISIFHGNAVQRRAPNDKLIIAISHHNDGICRRDPIVWWVLAPLFDWCVSNRLYSSDSQCTKHSIRANCCNRHRRVGRTSGDVLISSDEHFVLGIRFAWKLLIISIITAESFRSFERAIEDCAIQDTLSKLGVSRWARGRKGNYGGGCNYRPKRRRELQSPGSHDVPFKVRGRVCSIKIDIFYPESGGRPTA